MLEKPRTTEKAKNVLEQPETPGHGRNGASSYTGA